MLKIFSVQYTPTLDISERFGVDNITVTVEWVQKLSVNYITKVSPLALSILARNTSRQLVLRYNTEYNLSVVAVSPCTNFTAFVTVTLNYGKVYMLSSNTHHIAIYMISQLIVETQSYCQQLVTILSQMLWD